MSPADTTERLQSIQRLVADHTGETLPNFEHNVLQSIPIQAGSLYPITDVWYIEPALDAPDRLRTHIEQFAREIASEADLAACITPVETGIGFLCTPLPASPPASVFSRTVFAFLHALSVTHPIDTTRPVGLEDCLLDDEIGALLVGSTNRRTNAGLRLNDTALVKLFRLLRLARRLSDIETDSTNGDHIGGGTSGASP